MQFTENEIVTVRPGYSNNNIEASPSITQFACDWVICYTLRSFGPPHPLSGGPPAHVPRPPAFRERTHTETSSTIYGLGGFQNFGLTVVSDGHAPGTNFPNVCDPILASGLGCRPRCRPDTYSSTKTSTRKTAVGTIINNKRRKNNNNVVIFSIPCR